MGYYTTAQPLPSPVGQWRDTQGNYRCVDVIRSSEILRRRCSLEHGFGARFEPTPLLVEMARKGRRFHG